MITDGERIRSLLKGAERRIVLCAPFIKMRVLETVLSVVSESISIRVVTRWRPEEIAAGVSDLDVFELVNGRPNAELLLLDDLHAKLYVADDECLVGSANLTGSALGWAKRSNVELLVSTQVHDTHVAFLLRRLELAVAATFELRSKLEDAAGALASRTYDDIRDVSVSDEVRLSPWLPRCAAPERLFDIYRNAETTAVVKGTREDGIADLRDLKVPVGLSANAFNAVVGDTVRLIPTIGRIVEEIPRGVTDARGVALIGEARPDLVPSDANKQWRIVRDWIGVFFGKQFEVAPESFVIRLRPG